MKLVKRFAIALVILIMSGPAFSQKIKILAGKKLGDFIAEHR